MTLRITEADLRQDPERLLSLRDQGPWEFSLRGGVETNALSAALVLATATRFHHSAQRPLSAESLAREPSDAFVPAILSALRPPSEATSESSGGVPPSLVSQHISPGLVCVPTSVFLFGSVDRLLSSLARYFRDAAIDVPTRVMGLVASLVFETAVNAEEHGCVQLGEGTRHSFRMFAALHHRRRGPTVSEDAGAFVQRYQARFGAPGNGWLELLVVDSGMGMSYPGFQTRGGLGTGETDLYKQEATVERAWLQKALSTGFSTKRVYGRILNDQAQPGMGTDTIALRLQKAHAYAAVRAGRVLAEWPHLVDEAILGPRHLRPDFVVSPFDRPLYLGTAWQLLIPLDDQTGLLL